MNYSYSQSEARDQNKNLQDLRLKQEDMYFRILLLDYLETKPHLSNCNWKSTQDARSFWGVYSFTEIFFLKAMEQER